jgi:hypothetical protein
MRTGLVAIGAGSIWKTKRYYSLLVRSLQPERRVKPMLTFIEVAVSIVVLSIVFHTAFIYRTRSGALANRTTNWNG